MERNNNQLKIKHSLKYGLYLGMVSILLSLIFYLLNVNVFKLGLLNLFIIILIVTVFENIGIKKFRDNYNDKQIKFGKAFLIGAIIGIVGLLISGIYGYMFNVYFDPEYAENNIIELIDFYQSKGLSEEIIQIMIRRFEKMLTPIHQIQNFVSTAVIMGAIVSLIVAAIIKKDTTEQTV